MGRSGLNKGGLPTEGPIENGKLRNCASGGKHFSIRRKAAKKFDQKLFKCAARKRGCNSLLSPVEPMLAAGFLR